METESHTKVIVRSIVSIVIAGLILKSLSKWWENVTKKEKLNKSQPMTNL